MKIEKCPFCGKQIAEIGNCKNKENCSLKPESHEEGGKNGEKII